MYYMGSRISRCQHGQNNFEGETGKPYKDTLRSSVQTRLNRSRCHFSFGLAWAQSIMCYMGGPDPPYERAILVHRAPIVKYRHFVPQAVQKRLNRSICRFGCGLEWAEGCTCSIICARWRQCALMGGHVAVTCRITLNHPSTAAMRLMANYFDHLLSLDTATYTLHSRTDSQALRAEYCTVGIPHNTAI